MSERDDDRLETIEAQRAIAAAKLASAKTEASLASIHRAGSDIRLIVERNGYVDRFRAILRGA